MSKQKDFKVVHWINMGIFPGNVLLSAGFTYDELVAILKKKKAKDWLLGLSNEKEFLDRVFAVAMRRDIFNTESGQEKKLFYLFLKDTFDFSDYSYCVLAHEIVHICQFYLPDILDRNKEHEAEAYLHTHLMEQCLAVFRGRKG